MIQSLKWKPDLAETMARFADWWSCRNTDRPLLRAPVRPQREPKLPTKRHASWREYWHDVEYHVTRAAACMETQPWVAEAFPMFMPNVGPELTATLLGCELQYVNEMTGWADPIITDPEQWKRIAAAAPRFDGESWQVIERMTDRALGVSDGRFLVGMADHHGNYDILAALRDPQALCLDLMDCPELVRAAGKRVAEVFVEAFERNWAKLKAADQPCTTWTPWLHDGPAYLPSCDFWCMVSPKVGRELIWPDILAEMKPLERSLFHLDGPQALPHLDLLLSEPGLTGVQWVYGAGHGPARQWLDVYRRCLAAGKCIQVQAEGTADALAVAEALGPRGVWITMGQSFATAREAEDFVDALAKASHRFR